MIIRQIFQTIERSDIKYYNHVLTRYFCIDLTQGPVKRQERKLRKWQKEPVQEHKSIFSLFDRSQVPGVDKKALRDNSWFDPIRGEEPDTSFRALKELYLKSKTEDEKHDQRYIAARLNILGCDLAAAHFVTYRGGKVKFRYDDKWVQEINGVPPDLPRSFNPKYIISAIDCTNLRFHYEGLVNFENLTRCKWVSFSGNDVFDEWCLDRVVGQMPCLEYMDLSNCPKLNERGLEALYKLFYLKKLIVTNNEDSVAFELTCLMLEDCNPNLNCIILKPGETYKEKFEDESKS